MVLSTLCESTKSIKTLKVFSIIYVQERINRQILDSEAFKSIRGKLFSLHIYKTTENMAELGLALPDLY